MIQTRKSTLILALVLFLGAQVAYAQSSWEPQTNITGYASTEFNYFDDLAGFDYDYGATLSEAGLLINYKPLSNFSLKGVYVYRPGYKFDKMLNELSGEYTLASYLKVKAGRFLQSLSPMNTYYYAPVNTSAKLPIIVSNNEFFPLNIDGISLSGVIGQDFKVRYDFFGGSYASALFKETGAIGFFGNEVNYFYQMGGSDPLEFDDFRNAAYAGTVGFSYKNFVDIGVGFFNPDNEIVWFGAEYEADELYPGSPAGYQEFRLEVEKFTYGMNFKLQYDATKIVGELWRAELGMKNAGDLPAYQGYYAELSHRIDKITPYVRYEDQDAGDIDYSRITAGLNYKPTFETTFKLEYITYQNDMDDIYGLVGAFIFSF